jgi:signal transduction histidine kinase
MLRTRIWKNAAAILSSLAVSSLLALALRPFLHNQAALLPFTLAVILASSYGGLGAGLIATVLSFVIADLFFMEPLFQFMAVYPGDYALLLVFLMFGVTVSTLNHVRLRANAALRETNLKLQAAAGELTRSNEELQRFAHSVAHDLQEPLRAIRSFTELFLNSNRRGMEQESVRLLDFVVEGADRMRRLIDGILEFAKAGHQTNAAKAEVETRAVAERALQNLQSAIDEASASVTLRSLPVLWGNEDQFLRVFQNLIGNAIKYRGEHPPVVQISALRNPGEWVFSVKDNGIGIPPEYHSQVFETFYRLHGAAQYEGSGVGLATCKRIVNSMGGRIWVESAPGQGSTFSFSIPNAGGAAESRDAKSSLKPKPAQASERGDERSRSAAG